MIVVGAGKAAAAMAAAVEAHWSGPLEGLVVTRYGHGVPTSRIEIVEAAHPVPDAAGLPRARAFWSWCKGLSAGRSGAVPDLRRRLGAARLARGDSRSTTSRRSIARCCAAARISAR